MIRIVPGISSLTPSVALFIAVVMPNAWLAFATGVAHVGRLDIGLILFRRKRVLSSPMAMHMMIAPLGDIYPGLS